MANRARDWLRQWRRDLELARHAQRSGHYEWTCFAAQQAAEKAIRALILHLGGNPWGHAILPLLRDLPAEHEPSEALLRSAARLDRHYIPARYPNGYDSGIPADYLSLEDADQAVSDAEALFSFAQDRVP